MTERERIIEVLDAIENGMCKVAETRDIWQNDLVYALCEGERILLTARLKELNKKKKEPEKKSEKKTMTCREWITKHDPKSMDLGFIAGIVGCPDEHGLASKPSTCDVDAKCYAVSESICQACWGRPIEHDPSKE